MIFDQLFPTERSQLKRRSYATFPQLFRSSQVLDVEAGNWTSCLIFSDRNGMGGNSTAAGLVGSWPLVPIVLTAGAYACFPNVVAFLQPILSVQDALSDEVRAGLTGSFLPGISLLFGALLSFTISLLINRQTKIEDLVNEEVAHLSTAALHVSDLWRNDPERRQRALEAVWRHTDELIFRSRYQEILALVQDDPITDLMQMVIGVDEEMLAGPAHADKANINREVLNFLRNLMMELNRLRTLRLSSEGRVLPPIHFVILASLATLLVVGFTLASVQQAPIIATATAVTGGAGVAASTAAAAAAADAAGAASAATATAAAVAPPAPSGVAFESRLLFTGLVFSYSQLLEFALDLTNPFVGRYKIRRTTTTAGLIRIRNGVLRELGPKHIANFDQQLRSRRREQLREFAATVGQPLPIDGHL